MHIMYKDLNWYKYKWLVEKLNETKKKDKSVQRKNRGEQSNICEKASYSCVRILCVDG